MYYEMEIAGLKRKLPLFPVSDKVSIAAFIMFGDVEMTEAAARELLKKAPEFDILITAEAKSIPLIYEMSKQAGKNDYVIARKAPKVYMSDIIEASVESITTQRVQTICIGQEEVVKMKGRRVLIVDDVISTGDSLTALEQLVEKAGGQIVGKMAVLAEGDSMERPDVIALEKLPLFTPDGEIIE